MDASSPDTVPDTLFENVVCPLCGLGCDDLSVRVHGHRIEHLAGGAPSCRRWLEQAQYETGLQARIEDRAASMEEVTEQAARLLNEAALPVIGGLATDVNGVRSALRLAANCGAVVEHADGAGIARNLEVLQGPGWMSTTLTEVRNRTDLLVVTGERVFDQFPRLLERVFPAEGGLFLQPNQARELVLIGPWREADLPAELADRQPTLISVELSALVEIAGALRALIAGANLQAGHVHGVPVERLQRLAGRLQQASYGTVAWSAGELDYPHAGLAIEQLSELVRDLNAHTRCSILPLAGRKADMTANQVCAWLSGFPLRTAFRRGEPHYDPWRYDLRRLLASGEVDALVWIAGLTADLPPPTAEVPTIVVGHPVMTFDTPPAVFIPTGIPGIDHSGNIIRGDSVVSMPLRKLRASDLPSAAQALDRISKRLGQPDTQIESKRRNG